MKLLHIRLWTTRQVRCLTTNIRLADQIIPDVYDINYICSKSNYVSVSLVDAWNYQTAISAGCCHASHSPIHIRHDWALHKLANRLQTVPHYGWTHHRTTRNIAIGGLWNQNRCLLSHYRQHVDCLGRHQCLNGRHCVDLLHDKTISSDHWTIDSPYDFASIVISHAARTAVPTASSISSTTSTASTTQTVADVPATEATCQSSQQQKEQWQPQT